MSVSQQGNPAVFLDRDGTLIRDVGYLADLEQLEILERVPEALRLLSARGLKLVVITNQSGVARGYFDERRLREIHSRLEHRLAEAGARLDGIYYCPHHPTEGSLPYQRVCRCRKPESGLAERAARELGLDLKRSYVVGDHESDMELALRIGASGVLIEEAAKLSSASSSGAPPVRARSLWDAAEWIIGDFQRRSYGGIYGD